MQPAPWFMDLSLDALSHFAARYMRRVQERLLADGLEMSDLTVCQIAGASDPSPMTTEVAAERWPYTAPRLVNTWVEGAADRQLLLADGPGWRLAPKGRSVIDEMAASVREAAATPPAPLENGEAEELARLLGDVSDCCAEADAFPAPSLRVSRAYAPPPDALPLERIRRGIIDVSSYRDDAHTASWRGLAVQGCDWEAFSHVWGANVWGDPVAVLDDVAEKLAFRGYDLAAYDAAVRRLEERGWIAERHGTLSVTPEGEAVRDAAEEATDAGFFAPWDLSDEELQSLRALLTRLEAGLRRA